jgi:hypothetical protein
MIENSGRGGVPSSKLNWSRPSFITLRPTALPDNPYAINIGFQISGFDELVIHRFPRRIIV